MMSELGRKLVLTKSWRWLPGMLTLRGDRVKSVSDVGKVFLDRGFVTLDDANNWSIAYSVLDWDDFPNVSDSATHGAMLEVLRRSSGMTPSLFFKHDTETWTIELSSRVGETLTWVGLTQEDVFMSAFEGLDFNTNVKETK